MREASVLPVSIMSSTKMASAPLTSPTSSTLLRGS